MTEEPTLELEEPFDPISPKHGYSTLSLKKLTINKY